MGCGPSNGTTIRDTQGGTAVKPVSPRDAAAIDTDDKSGNSSTSPSQENGNTNAIRPLHDTVMGGKVPKLDRIHIEKSGKHLEPRKPVPKGIAFDVQLEGNTRSNQALDKLTQRRPPRRLDALQNAPKLTAADLEKKLEAAENKRSLALEKRRGKKERKKKNFMKAENGVKSQEQARKLEEKLRAGLENREKLLTQRVEKQRRQRKHEKKVREKARSRKDDDPTAYGSENEIETFEDSEEEPQWDTVPEPVAEQEGEEEDKSLVSGPKIQPSEEPDPLVDDFYDT